MVRNGRVHPAARDEVAAEVPPRTRRTFDRYGRCQRCGQVLRAGSHLDALTGLLARVDDEGR